MENLNILPENKCKHDFITLGALVTRMDPGQIPFPTLMNINCTFPAVNIT